MLVTNSNYFISKLDFVVKVGDDKTVPADAKATCKRPNVLTVSSMAFLTSSSFVTSHFIVNIPNSYYKIYILSTSISAIAMEAPY